MAEGTDGRRIMTASEILDKIENVEPIDYDHEIIKVISILAGEICRKAAIDFLSPPQLE